MSARDAQKIAYEKDLDLVKIAPGAKPPVCRIMDYGKYCFEQQKREKEARKNQKVVSIKEIRMFLPSTPMTLRPRSTRQRSFCRVATS